MGARKCSVLDGQHLPRLSHRFCSTLEEPRATDRRKKSRTLRIARAGKKVAKRLFSLRLLLDPAPFAMKTRDLDGPTLSRVVELQRRFQEAQIQNEVIEFSDREQIAIIFERINRAGVPLDTFQLLTAWTWSNEFDLNERVENLGAEVEPYGFSRIGLSRIC